MKKASILILMMILCISLVSCSTIIRIINKPYQDRMREYYSNDENYVDVEGEILKFYYDSIYLPNPTEYHFEAITNNECAFQFYSHKEIMSFLAEGDIVKITSATKCFYDGHHAPVVSLEVNGEILLTFEEGKAGLLDWIEDFA